MSFENKVFCLGAFRTGTVSLAVALRALGLRVCESHEKLEQARNDFVWKDDEEAKLYQDLTPHYDAFAQQPVGGEYEQLYAGYPDAHFILTIRNPEDWVRSRAALMMHTWFYLDKNRHKKFGPAESKCWFNKHNGQVLDFFDGRPEAKFLVMDITKGDGWDKLCPFLGLEVPKMQFPHRNTSKTMLEQILTKASKR